MERRIEMKRLFALMLAVALVFSLVGCKSKETKEVVIYSCANDMRIAEMAKH